MTKRTSGAVIAATESDERNCIPVSRLVSIEANPKADKGTLLCSVTTLLCDYRLTPELLLWLSLEGDGEAKLWLMLNGEAPVMDVFAERCRDMVGVQYFAQYGAGEEPPAVELRAHLASAGLRVSSRDILGFCAFHGIHRDTQAGQSA